MKLVLALCALLPFVLAEDIPPLGSPKIYHTTLSDPILQEGVRGINDMYRKQGDNALRSAIAIIRSTEQLVSGTRFSFILEVSGGPTNEICDVDVLVIPWLHEMQIVDEPKCQTLENRGAQLVGAPEEVDFNDAQVQLAYQHLEERVNMAINCMCYVVGTSAQQVTKQVVAGIKYHFEKVQFHDSDCTKADKQASPNRLCTAKATNAISVCSGDVIVSPGTNPTYTIENFGCQSPTQKRAGEVEDFKVDVNDYRVGYAVQALNNYFNDDRQRVPVAVLYASKQVVSGFIYNFTLKLSSSGSSEICNVAIWAQEWLADPAERIKIDGPVSCTPLPSLRDLAGAPTVVQMSDDGVQEAFNHLQKRINEMHNGLDYLKGGQPGKITKQVVNGLKYVFTDVPFYRTDCLRADGDVNVNRDCTAGPHVQDVCAGEVVKSSGPNPSFTVSNEICVHQHQRRAVGVPTEVQMSDDGVQEAFNHLQKKNQ